MSLLNRTVCDPDKFKKIYLFLSAVVSLGGVQVYIYIYIIRRKRNQLRKKMYYRWPYTSLMLSHLYVFHLY